MAAISSAWILRPAGRRSQVTFLTILGPVALVGVHVAQPPRLSVVPGDADSAEHGGVLVAQRAPRHELAGALVRNGARGHQDSREPVEVTLNAARRLGVLRPA
jgi:hypothetical protein